MTRISFPYGKTKLEYTFEKLNGVLTSRIEDYIPSCGERDLVEQALENPIGSVSLAELAEGKRKIVIIASDHTRPVPSKVIMPAMLRQIRKGNPEAEITILIATGCHRETTKQELTDKFGPEIVEQERIVIHDCDDRNSLVNLGRCPPVENARSTAWHWKRICWWRRDLLSLTSLPASPVDGKASCRELRGGRRYLPTTAQSLSIPPMPGQVSWRTIPSMKICSGLQRRQSFGLLSMWC